MPKNGQKLKHHTGDFKKAAVLDVQEHGLGLRETVRKFGVTHKMRMEAYHEALLAKGIRQKCLGKAIALIMLMENIFSQLKSELTINNLSLSRILSINCTNTLNITTTNESSRN